MTLAIIAYCIATILDVATTMKVLEQGGRELNPVIRWIMKHTGDQWWIGKLGINAIALVLLMYVGAAWAIWLGAGLTGLVALNNWRQVK